VDKLAENDIVFPSDVRGTALNEASRVISQMIFEE
jgi:hypothetical protein